jgi:5'-nucleotidase
MKDDRPLILLTNDDGIHAEGLRFLRRAARQVGRVGIVAPETERSAVGHAISLHDPIKVREIFHEGRFYGFGVDGTPADAVKLGINSLMGERPALVISGINNGANVGINVLYSGTVSAATEAAILGVPGLAVSLAQKKDPPYEYAAHFVPTIAEWILNNSLPPGVALNVNVPALAPDKIPEIRFTRQSVESFAENYEQREDPRGNIYYWLSGEIPPEEHDPLTDVGALKERCVSVTPLFYDLTAHAHTRSIAESFEQNGRQKTSEAAP